jgi:RNA polymerase sigma-70 factor (ECF subfamily)
MAIGTTAEFADFYAAHFQRLAAQLHVYLGDAEEAQDLTQEAFCRAFDRWDRVQSYDDPSGWVRRVAWNLATSALRRRMTARRYLSRQREEYLPGPQPDGVALTRALATLPPRQRRAVVLHHVAQLSTAEIAQQEGVAESTVRTWLTRGRTALAARLADDEPRLARLAVQAGTGFQPAPLAAVTVEVRRRRRTRRTALGVAVVAVVAAPILLVSLTRGTSPAPTAPTPTPSVVTSTAPGPEPDLRLLRAPAAAHTGDPSQMVGSSVDFSPDGQTIATGGQDRIIRLWDPTDGSMLGELPGHEDMITDLAFNPATGELVSGSWDGTVRFWDTTTRTQVARLDVIDEVSSLAYSADGTTLVVGAGWRIEVFDATTRASTWEVTLPNISVDRVAISPDGHRVVAMTNSSYLEPDSYLGYLWEPGSGRLIAELAGHTSYPRGVAYSVDGEQVVTVGFDGLVQRFRADTGELIEQITDNDAGVNDVEFSPDGRYAALCDGWFIDLRDARSGDLIRREPAFITEGWSLAFSPDSTMIAAVAWGGELAVWTVT